MLNCRQITALITDYLEGRLSLMDRVRFRMHVGMCGSCRRYLKQMKLAVAALGKVPAEPVPDEVMKALLDRFGGWKG